MSEPKLYSPPQAEVADLEPSQVPRRPLGPPPLTPRIAGFLGSGGFVMGVADLYIQHGEHRTLLLALAVMVGAVAVWGIDVLVRKAMRSLPWAFAFLGFMAVAGIRYYETSPPGVLRTIYVGQGIVLGLAAVLFLFPSSLRWFKRGNA